MASVQLRGEVWYACVRVTDPQTGRRRQKQVRLDPRQVRTEKQARRRADRLQEEIDAGQWADAGKLTVDAYLSRWLEDNVAPRVAGSTLQGYGYAVRRWSELLRGTRLDRLQPAQVQAACRQALDSGLSPSTLGEYYMVFRSAMRQAVAMGLLARNPTDGVRLPKRASAEPAILDRGAALRFLAAARQDAMGLRVTLALGLGLRRGEVMGLCWTDINWQEDQVQIRRSLQQHNREFKAPKSGKARTVGLPQFVRLALQDEWMRQWGIREKDPEWNPGALVCPGVDGRPVSFDTGRTMARICRAAGLPRTHLHALRHTFASLAIRDGSDIAAVSKTLGHAKTSITVDVYLHEGPAARQDVARRIGRLLADR